MAQIIIDRTVNLDAAGRVEQLQGTLYQAEELAHKFVIHGVQDGAAVTFSGTVTGSFIRADAYTVPLTGAVEDGAAAITLTDQCYDVTGRFTLTIFLTSGDTTTALYCMTGNVKQTETGSVVDPGTLIPSISNLITTIETARATIPASYDDLQEGVAPFYADLTYPVSEGQFCWYEGVLYKATADIATSETWTAAHWTAASIGTEMCDLKSAISTKITEPATEGTAGQALVTDGNGGRSWATVEIEVDATLTQAGEAADAKAVGDIFDEITDVQASKNLYNSAACSPSDGYMYNSSGVYTASTSWATTGKIPVEASTQYIFSAGGARVKAARYFKGSDGSTFISGENVDDGPFTTPAECTYVAINLFATTHTTAEYNAAIAVAQLEKGATAHEYEPYGDTRHVPLSAVQDGDKLSGISGATEIQSQVNLYDKSLAVNGKYYYTNGTVQTDSNWAITGLIPVLPNTQYNISRDPDTPMPLGGSVKMYDAEQGYIGNANLGNYIYTTLYAFVTGPTTYYIGVSLTLESHTEQNFQDTIDSLMLCYGTQRPLTYSAYNAETVIKADNLSNTYQTNPDCFTGKKWLATGTSITWYDGKTYADGEDAGDLCRGYVGNVSRRKKLLVTNDGISGATLGNVSQFSLINRYTTLDWVNFDIATLEFGVNDLGNNVTVGTANDAAGNDTFAACLKTVIEYALTQNPRLCLVICTEPDVRGANTNTNGNTLKDYSDVTLAIADIYRLPVCDWYYRGGFNTLTKGTNKLTIEGTHPNNAGHMRMGAMLNQVFDSLIC